MLYRELKEGGAALAGLDQQDSGIGPRDSDGYPGKAGTRAKVGYDSIRRAHGLEGSKRVQDMPLPDAAGVSLGHKTHRNGVCLEKRFVPPQAIPLIL